MKTHTTSNQEHFMSFIIEYIKDELSKSNIRTEIIKPILMYLLYYIIPFVIMFVVINFLTTIAAIFLVFHFFKKKHL